MKTILEYSVALLESPPGGAIAPALASDLDRPSRPIAGRSLGASVTAVEAPVRAAVAIICSAIKVSPEAGDSLLGGTRYAPGAKLETRELRVAWAVVCIALIHARTLGKRRTRGFEEALLWFARDNSMVSSILGCARTVAWKSAELELAQLQVNDDLWDLLPYVLEPHGHVTRTRLETCNASRATRNAKKSAGVFYTPSDVAEFVVRTASGTNGANGTWLDPACGTGVFLRAVLARARGEGLSPSFDDLGFIEKSLFGIDRSALATDLASFVLLAECVRGACDLTPIDAWRAIRPNIVCGDALRIAPPVVSDQMQITEQDQVQIERLFGASARHGFDHVVMNPPYASVPITANGADVWTSFRAKRSLGVADAHTAFTEMLWKFTHAHGSSAAVLPLSIGTNTSAAYRALREELAKLDAAADFLFFDREPQALFGEDIKTRNLILIVRRTPGRSPIARTSRMLKWTSKQRPSILRMDRLVPLNGLRFEGFVPKLGSSQERDVYQHISELSSHRDSSPHAPTFSRATISELLDAPTDTNDRSVLVSATAYNFLNVFFVSGLPKRSVYPFSTSPLNRVSFVNAKVARAALAILCSRLSFWLWHAQGDGFHVTSEFLRRLPLWSVLSHQPTLATLAELGELYWTAAKTHRIDSVNGGKQTSSFHPGYRHVIYSELDELLLQACESPVKSPRFLDSFIEAIVSVDGTQRDRGLRYHKE